MDEKSIRLSEALSLGQKPSVEANEEPASLTQADGLPDLPETHTPLSSHSNPTGSLSVVTAVSYDSGPPVVATTDVHEPQDESVDLAPSALLESGSPEAAMSEIIPETLSSNEQPDTVESKSVPVNTERVVSDVSQTNKEPGGEENSNELENLSSVVSDANALESSPIPDVEKAIESSVLESSPALLTPSEAVGSEKDLVEGETSQEDISSSAGERNISMAEPVDTDIVEEAKQVDGDLQRNVKPSNLDQVACTPLEIEVENKDISVDEAGDEDISEDIQNINEEELLGGDTEMTEKEESPHTGNTIQGHDNPGDTLHEPSSNVNVLCCEPLTNSKDSEKVNIEPCDSNMDTSLEVDLNTVEGNAKGPTVASENVSMSVQSPGSPAGDGDGINVKSSELKSNADLGNVDHHTSRPQFELPESDKTGDQQSGQKSDEEQSTEIVSNLDNINGHSSNPGLTQPEIVKTVDEQSGTTGDNEQSTDTVELSGKKGGREQSPDIISETVEPGTTESHEEAEHFELANEDTSDRINQDEDDDNLLGSLSQNQNDENGGVGASDEVDDPLLSEANTEAVEEMDKERDVEMLDGVPSEKEKADQGRVINIEDNISMPDVASDICKEKGSKIVIDSVEVIEGTQSREKDVEHIEGDSRHEVGLDPMDFVETSSVTNAADVSEEQSSSDVLDMIVQKCEDEGTGSAPTITDKPGPTDSPLLIDQADPEQESGDKDDDEVEITGELNPLGRISVVQGLFQPKTEDGSNNEPTIEEVIAKSPKKLMRGKRTLIIIHSGKIVEGFDELKVATCAECGMTKEMLYEFSNESGLLHSCSQRCFNAYERKSGPCWITKVSFHLTDKESLPDLSSDWTGIRHYASQCAQCQTVIAPNANSLSWETMEFCSVNCVNEYQTILGITCVYCNANVKPSYLGKYCVRFGRELKQFCCNDCLEKYKPNVKICAYCQRDITKMSGSSCLAQVGETGAFKDFCSIVCIVKYDDLLNLENLGVDNCTVCNKNSQVRAKIDFDEKNFVLCSDPCISAFKFVNQIKAENCDTCSKLVDKDKDQPFSITHYVGQKRIRLFCSQGCLNRFVTHSRQIVSCSWCRVKKYNFDLIRVEDQVGRLFFCSVVCLNQHSTLKLRRTVCKFCPNQADPRCQMNMAGEVVPLCPSAVCKEKCKEKYPEYASPIITAVSSLRTISQSTVLSTSRASPTPSTPIITLPPPAPPTPPIPAKIPVEITQRVIFKRDPPPMMSNKSIDCRPKMASKGTYFTAPARDVETQTDIPERVVYVPVPVPMYVPAPMMMYSAPFPVLLPIPLPVPVPIFLPVPKKTHQEIEVFMKKIIEELPNNPLEADLLAMAAMIADEAETGNIKPSEDLSNGDEKLIENGTSASNHGFSNGKSKLDQDLLQILATADIDPSELGVDASLDSASNDFDSILENEDAAVPLKIRKGKKRGRSSTATPKGKKKKAQSEEEETPKQSNLKLEYGLNAWKKWVVQKNQEIEKLVATGKKGLKPFKTDLLKMTPEEVCSSLCYFVTEIKKPDGVPYAPDSIYYLCLGIQQYLYENSRVDNIFADFYYERFSIFLDNVIGDYVNARGDEAYLASRIEEEHLWECRQLGAHSPQVLLYTLMYFNTKYFGLKNVADHHTLSFVSVVKSWRRVQGGSLEGAKGSQITRLVTLKHLIQSKKKGEKPTSREMLENWENPLRCPVKLYEFYISKCPESARNRSDLYYISPERSCVPDSPVWYSTRQVPDEVLQRMINRTLLVRDVNESLQTVDTGDS